MDSAAADWARSGLAYLTGPPGGPPDYSRAAVLAEARRVTADIFTLSGVEADAAAILAGRAALRGLYRRGRISAGGATRLLPTTDGWCAIALPRGEDIEALPALLETDTAQTQPWPALSAWAAGRSSAAVVARAQLLDVAAAALG
ncbi:MAG: CoA transferase, partial [Mycobacterium sp.]